MKSKKKASPSQSNLFNELELPDGWILTKVRDLVTINYGKGLKEADRRGGSVSVYGSNGIVGSHNKALTNGPSIIIGRKGSIGEVHYSANPSWPIDTTYYIDKFEGVDQTFLVFALKMLNLSNLDTSTAIPGLNRDDIYDQEIPLPPRSEQQRIVARVEALLTHVDAARDRLSRVPLIMKKFRQAVLAAACSGRLTEGWREENLSDVRVDQIYEKIQNLRHERFKNDCESAIKLGQTKPRDQNKNKQSRNQVSDLPELPIEWTYYRLEDISYLITDGTHVTPKYQETGIPFLSVKNVRPFLIRDNNIKHISQSEYTQINQRCNPEKEDILYTKVGATYGYAAINRLDYSFSIFVSLALIKPVKEYFSPEYAEIVMNSEIIFEQARDRISGIGTPDLHLIEIRDFRIPFPPLAEQHEIVRRVGLLFERADAIEREVVAASRRCERLTQAVLGKAFRGELVTAGMADFTAI
jgi:type I restriction enzyme S subunit